MKDEHCSGCGAIVGTGVCMCPDGTRSVEADRDFWKERAIWWCAYAENGLRSEPDARDLQRAAKIIECEGIEKR